MLYDLGGIDKVDLNFSKCNKVEDHCPHHKKVVEFQSYPIMSAVAKGNLGLMQVLLNNKTIDVNVKDP